jgi:hypothetical protein
MIPLTGSAAALIDTAHVVHGVDATGHYLGLVARAQAYSVAIGAPPDDGTQFWVWNVSQQRWVGAPTAATIAARVRAERDARLRATDWVRFRAIDLGQPSPPLWLAYWQALRDIPEQTGFPQVVIWPVAPPTA